MCVCLCSVSNWLTEPFRSCFLKMSSSVLVFGSDALDNPVEFSLLSLLAAARYRVLNPVSRRLQMLMCEAVLRIGALCSFTLTTLPINHGSGR